MTDQERLAEYSKYIDKLETDLCVLAAQLEKCDAALAAVRQDERDRVLGLLEEWREAMTSVGQLHSLEYMLNEVRVGNLPERHATVEGEC